MTNSNDGVDVVNERKVRVMATKRRIDDEINRCCIFSFFDEIICFLSVCVVKKQLNKGTLFLLNMPHKIKPIKAECY